MSAEWEACVPIWPPGGASTLTLLLILKPSTTPSSTYTNYAPAGDPSPVSHFLPSGYFATPAPPSVSQLPSLPQIQPPRRRDQPHPLTPPSASRASGAPREPLILRLSPQDPGQSEKGPHLRLRRHTPLVRILPPSPRRGSTRTQPSQTSCPGRNGPEGRKETEAEPGTGSDADQMRESFGHAIQGRG